MAISKGLNPAIEEVHIRDVHSIPYPRGLDELPIFLYKVVECGKIWWDIHHLMDFLD
jgi:hypothetical protein